MKTSQFKAGGKVLVFVNSVYGSLPANVVRNVTGEDWAKSSCPHIEGEQLFEIRFSAGRRCGTYSVVAARHMVAA